MNKQCYDKDKKVCKGVPRAHIRENLSFDKFKECLFSEEDYYVSGIHSFRSKNFHMYTTVTNKKALSCADDKRVLRHDSHDTYAIGHYRTLNSLSSD